MLVPQGGNPIRQSLNSKEKRKQKESIENCMLRRKAKKEEEVKKNKGFKTSIVITKKGGFVSGTFECKDAWDDWIHILNKKYLHYSIIIDINSQWHSNIEKNWKKMNEEFEDNVPLLSFHALKRKLASFMK